LSQGGEKSYVQRVLESARSMWGSEDVEQFKDHITRTAQAVYSVSTYPLEPEKEPVTKLRHVKDEETI
jgi:hypothetical protein